MPPNLPSQGRQMTLPIPIIDHVIINARDTLDDTAALWSRLGFQLTPRGHHTLGSSNHLAILGTDYIELLGVQPGNSRTDVLNWPAGLNGLVFKTTDSDRLYATIAEAGAPVLPPQAFSRPVELGDQTGDAAFRTVRLVPDAAPAGRMFFCHHLTPDLVWHDPWRRHPNAVTGIAGMVIAAEDPATYAALFALLFGESSIRQVDGGIVLTAGLASIEVLDRATATARLQAPLNLQDRSSAMVALTLRTASLKRTRTALTAGGFNAPATGPIILPPTESGGPLLTFVQ